MSAPPSEPRSGRAIGDFARLAALLVGLILAGWGLNALLTRWF
ncbi:MAG: hypothetical protein U0836_02095 [Pirellulales bacterium]